MKLGFVGLGQMGRHMAANLANGAAELIAIDRNLDRFPPLEAKGARTSTAIGDVTEADIIFTCLPGAEAVAGALLGDAGIGNRLRAGQSSSTPAPPPMARRWRSPWRWRRGVSRSSTPLCREWRRGPLTRR